MTYVPLVTTKIFVTHVFLIGMTIYGEKLDLFF